MQHTHNRYIIIIIVHVIAIYISNRFILFSFFFRLCQSKMALNFESISIIIIIRWWFNNNGKQPQKQTERKNRKWKKIISTITRKNVGGRQIKWLQHEWIFFFWIKDASGKIFFSFISLSLSFFCLAIPDGRWIRKKWIKFWNFETKKKWMNKWIIYDHHIW